MRPIFALRLCACLVLGLASAIAQAAEHRATRLGNPATRFAEPLQTVEDLRRVLLAEPLREDVTSILRQGGYTGEVEDFRKALARASIREISVQPDTRLTAMSTRVKGKPVLLHDVRWAGREAFQAYEFTFDSQRRRYRVTVPQPCSNFWVEEVLPAPAPFLSMNCEAPGRQPLPRAFTVCNVLRNSGNNDEPKAVVSMPLPAELKVVASDGAVADGRITWKVEPMQPGAVASLCATVLASKPGAYGFAAESSAQYAAAPSSRCETQVYGIPAVLLEVIDAADPVMVGGDVVYVIRVRNQGSTTLTNLRIGAVLEDSQSFVSGSGASAVSIDARSITAAPLPSLEPGASVEWRVAVKAVRDADVRFAVELRVEELQRPVNETEATRQY